MESSGTHGESFVTRLDIIIKKRENMHIDRCGNTSEDEYHAEGSIKKTNTREYTEREREKTDVEYEMCVYTGNNWSY
jgi:hypothetical protein